MYKGDLKIKAKYCKKCLYPSLSASPMQFDENGICMGCKIHERKYLLVIQNIQIEKKHFLKL